MPEPIIPAPSTADVLARQRSPAGRTLPALMACMPKKKVVMAAFASLVAISEVSPRLSARSAASKPMRIELTAMSRIFSGAGISPRVLFTSIIGASLAIWRMLGATAPPPGYLKSFWSHGWHDLVHQSLLQGFGRAQLLAFQQQRQRLLEADQRGQAHHAAGTRQQPERDFGQSDHGMRRIDHDSAVAGQAEFEAAAQRSAIDGGDDRHLQFFQLAVGRLVALDHHEGRLVSPLDLEQTVQVST